jgi:hypothetical protein
MRTDVVVLLVGLFTVVGLPAIADQPSTVLGVNQAPVARSVPDGPDTALNQPPNASNGIFSDIGCDMCTTGIQIVGDNVVVSTGGMGYEPDEITIWGGFYPNNTPVPVTFDIFFYPDSGGVPGATPTCYATGISPTSDILTGVTLFGVSEHEILLTISGCTLSDGTYWLVWYTDTGLGTDDFFWETGTLDGTSGVAGSVWTTANPPTTWTPDAATDMSVLLTGTILPVEIQSFSIK